ncbi:ionotropic receptor 25a-like [Anopheles coustani]|uniref:ionotropic receptor 25a-like n=1 Tax=Anopheles coustani TaxID=139045 RepID=UPI0026595792|nr:ionotropic receptor 25a-like [Anopheles coustani]
MRLISCDHRQRISSCGARFRIGLLDKFSPYSARNNKAAYPYECRNFTMKESCWFALTSSSPLSGDEASKALSGRTLVAAYWLFVVFLLATFTVNLAAFLTVERMQTPVQSLEQLSRQNRIKYTVVQNSDTHEYLRNMKNDEDVLYQMWRNLTLSSGNEPAQFWDYLIKERNINILTVIESAEPVASAADGFRRVNERLDADFPDAESLGGVFIWTLVGLALAMITLFGDVQRCYRRKERARTILECQEKEDRARIRCRKVRCTQSCRSLGVFL